MLVSSPLVGGIDINPWAYSMRRTDVLLNRKFEVGKYLAVVMATG